MLPRPMTSFIGREADISTVSAMLTQDDVRLLTLVGPGGVGKTRLAIGAASGVAGAFPDGVWFVPLASVSEPDLVAPAIMAAFGTVPSAGSSPPEHLLAVLGNRHALLVLDNFEQVIDAAPLISTLLSGCPQLTVLVTSRQVLTISGEQVFVVPPFGLPQSHLSATVETVATSDAVRLFVERAIARDARFSLSPHNAADIAAICHSLDGLPLAIELAAAQINVLSPAVLHQRLDQRLALLNRGPIDVPDRQRTMRGTIAWSYDLLDECLQVAFRRLSVFVGGFTLDAASAVIADGNDAFDIVGALVRRSLLNARHSAGTETRFWMLETVREFALERLAASGNSEATRDRHAAYMQSVADSSAWGWFQPLAEGATIQARLAAETANIRAALEWLEERDDPDSLLRLTGSLGALWGVSGDPREGQVWLERALARSVSPPPPPEVRAQALNTLSWTHNKQGHIEPALATAEESLRLCEEFGNREGMISSHFLLSVAAQWLGDLARATIHLDAALAELEHLRGTSWAHNAMVQLHSQLGMIWFRKGDLELAEAHLHRAIELEEEAGHRAGTSHVFASHTIAQLGGVSRARGDEELALSQYRTALELAWTYRDIRGAAHALGGVASALAALGNVPVAARLFGASQALHEKMGYPFAAETFDWQRAIGLPEPWGRADSPFGRAQPLRETIVSRQRPSLPAIPNVEEAKRQWAAGRSRPIESAITEALSARGVPTPTEGLSSREVEVLRLLVNGKTDGAIADELSISRRTAATHVAHIYGKIGVSTRAEAAAWAVRRGIA